MAFASLLCFSLNLSSCTSDNSRITRNQGVRGSPLLSSLMRKETRLRMKKYMLICIEALVLRLFIMRNTTWAKSSFISLLRLLSLCWALFLILLLIYVYGLFHLLMVSCQKYSLRRLCFPLFSLEISLAYIFFIFII